MNPTRHHKKVDPLSATTHAGHLKITTAPGIFLLPISLTSVGMKYVLVVIVIQILSLTRSLSAAETFVPDGRVKRDDYTVLMAVDAKLSEGLIPFQTGGHAKFFVQPWNRPQQQAVWTIRADAGDEYEASVVIRSRSGKALRVEVAAAGRTCAATIAADQLRRWDRFRLEGVLKLPPAQCEISLHISAADGSSDFDAQVHAVKLVRPSVRNGA